MHRTLPTYIYNIIQYIGIHNNIVDAVMLCALCISNIYIYIYIMTNDQRDYTSYITSDICPIVHVVDKNENDQ